MLELIDVHTYYGESQILYGISLEVKKGSVVAILGRNGMGKTTIIRSIVGFTPARYGKIILNAKEISNLPPHQITKMGIGLVPQGRRIFPSLSVKECLTMAARRNQGDEWCLDRVYSLFPILKERANFRSHLLSGGEQQMLSIARALMTNPQLLLMDEPSEGLAPLIVQEVGNVVNQLHKGGFSILLVEQNFHLALRIANYVYIISKGEVVYESTPGDLRNNDEVKDKHLGVAKR